VADIKTVLIVSGGKACTEAISLLLSKESFSMIIAADRGLETVDQLKLIPDYILGDFDSVSRKLLDKYKAMELPIISYPAQKDMTDTQIAIELAMSHKPDRIIICGATGSRADHMLANIHLLLHPLRAGIDACIIDNNNKIYLRNKSFSIKKSEQYGKYVSLLPFTDGVSGISLTGFKYPLNNAELANGSSLGVSNEIEEACGMVSFREGILLVVESRD